MKRLKAPEWIILTLLLAGLSLGGLGMLLNWSSSPDTVPPVCAETAGPLCGTPYRVVRYKVEPAEVQPAAAAGSYIPASIPAPLLGRPAPGEPVPAERRPGGRAGDTLQGKEAQPMEAKNYASVETLVKPASLITPLAHLAVLAAANQTAAVLARDVARPARTGEEAAETAPPDPEVEATPAKPPSLCPEVSQAQFNLIPVEGPLADHADRSHGDLNLDLRGYSPVAEPAGLVDYNGPADPDAPQLAGLFEPNRPAAVSAGYRVNGWTWDAGQCGGQVNGCAGPPIAEWPVTLIGLATTPGEAIYPPRRRAEIYGGGYIALVLYAGPTQLTLGYTRRDSVAAGYVVHLENICVDPNLVALYEAQNTGDGWRSSAALPALRPGQALGTALGAEVRVAIRDNGNFLDPRSRKDWWQGY